MLSFWISIDTHFTAISRFKSSDSNSDAELDAAVGQSVSLI